MIINDHCDKGKYISMFRRFMGILRVFHKYFEGALMSFHEYSQKNSNVSLLRFKGVL